MGFLSSIGKAVSKVADFASSDGGGSLLGGLFSGGASLLGGSQANSANAGSARQQMAFQQQMSSTSYQRAVKDMRKAGLNPMLAYMQGGASTPGGASFSSQDTVTPAVNTGLASKRVSNETAINRATVDNLLESNKKISSDTQLNQALIKSAHADAVMKSASARNVSVQTAATLAAMPRNEAIGAAAAAATGPLINLGKGANWLQNKLGNNMFEVWQQFHKGAK